MNLASSVEPAGEVLWEFPFNLSDVASRAAVELDNLLLGKSRDLQATTDLIEYITDSIPENANSVKSGTGLDTTTVIVLNRAIGDSSVAAHTVSTVADLATEIHKILRQLEDFKSNRNDSEKVVDEKLVKLRDFCLALSKSASLQEMPSRDLEPQHPFRT